MPKIRSSAELRNSYNEISTFCHDYSEPVFITKNGKGDFAVMSIEAYEQLVGRFELLSISSLMAKKGNRCQVPLCEVSQGADGQKPCSLFLKVIVRVFFSLFALVAVLAIMTSYFILICVIYEC